MHSQDTFFCFSSNFLTPRRTAAIIMLNRIQCFIMTLLFSTHRTIIFLLIAITAKFKLNGLHVLFMNTFFPLHTKVIFTRCTIFITQ